MACSLFVNWERVEHARGQCLTQNGAKRRSESQLVIYIIYLLLTELTVLTVFLIDDDDNPHNWAVFSAISGPVGAIVAYDNVRH